MTGHRERDLIGREDVRHRGIHPCPVCGASTGQAHRPAVEIEPRENRPDPDALREQRPTEEL